MPGALSETRSDSKSTMSRSASIKRDELDEATVEALLRQGRVAIEGWLHKKGGGTKAFLGRRNWRRLILNEDAFSRVAGRCRSACSVHAGVCGKQEREESC